MGAANSVTGGKYIRNLQPAPVAEEKRQHPRTREFGAQDVEVRRASPAETITAKLWDFSYGGIGMDIPKPLKIEEEIQLSANLLNPDYSMRIESTGRVVHCRSIARDLYRVGVAFIDVTYHRLNQG